MARYSDDSRERVRDAVDMVDLVGQRTELRRSGVGRYTGLCPFHEERTPSFSVNVDDKLYHCFGCGKGGDCFAFVMETEGLDFVAAMEGLAGRYGVHLEPVDDDPQAAERRRRRERLLALLERAQGYYARHLWESPEAQPARTLMEERGLERASLEQFGAGYAPNAWDKLLVASRRAGFSEEEVLAAGLARPPRDGKGSPYDPFRGRLIFPLADLRGHTIGFGARAMRDGQRPKYVNTAEGELFHKGRILYGAHLARAEAARLGQVVLAEGYTDVIALHQAGVRCAVGIMGTSLTEQQVEGLAKLLGREGGQVLLALDADAAGQEAMVRAARMLAGRKLELRVVRLPPGSDPADLLGAEGAERLRERFSESIPFVRFQVERALEQGDTAGAEGKDRILASLRPALANLPVSALRQELLDLLSARLELPVELVTSVIGGGSMPSRPPGPATGAPAAAAPGARAAMATRERIERTFLSLCLALPVPARRRLEQLDIEELFTGDLPRRAATHLRTRLETPLADLGEDDAELRAFIEGLQSRAARLRGKADETALEMEALQLELARLERAIARGGLVADLAAERQRIRTRISELAGGD